MLCQKRVKMFSHFFPRFCTEIELQNMPVWSKHKFETALKSAISVRVCFLLLCHASRGLIFSQTVAEFVRKFFHHCITNLYSWRDQKPVYIIYFHIRFIWYGYNPGGRAPTSPTSLYAPMSGAVEMFTTQHTISLWVMWVFWFYFKLSLQFKGNLY